MVGKNLNPILIGSKGDIILANAWMGKHLVLKGTSQYASLINYEVASKIVELLFNGFEVPVIEKQTYAVIPKEYAIELVKKALQEVEKERKVEIVEERKAVAKPKFKSIKDALTWLFQVQNKEIEEWEERERKEYEEVMKERSISQFEVLKLLAFAKNGKLAISQYLRIIHPPLVKSYPIKFSKFE